MASTLSVLTPPGISSQHKLAASDELHEPNYDTIGPTSPTITAFDIPLKRVYTTKVKLSKRSSISPVHVLSGVVLLIVILLQSFSTRDNFLLEIRGERRRPVLPVELYNQLVDPERFKNYGQCENYRVFGDPFPTCRPSSMALLKEARRIAEQFAYPDEDVNKGVREFIKQMDEGLEKQGATMSQIPSYVTAVPNGTEKVFKRSLFLEIAF